MRRPLLHRVATAAALVAVAVPVAGCGKDDGPKIPRQQARTLIARLQEAKRRSSPLRCQDLSQDTIPALQQEADSLPKGKVRDTVVEAIDHLQTLVEAECAAKEQQQQTDTTDTTQTTDTTTETQTQTTDTTTTPPTTDTNTTPPTTDTTPTSPSGGTPPGQQNKQKKVRQLGGGGEGGE